jgi:hypothetical protein
MKTKTFISKQEINTTALVEVKITFNDIVDIISSCDYIEKSEIRNIIGNDYDDLDFDEVYSIVNNFNFSKHELEEMKNIIYGEVDKSLYDDLKNKVMKVALEKYDLDELQRRLDIKYY